MDERRDPEYVCRVLCRVLGRATNERGVDPNIDLFLIVLF